MSTASNALINGLGGSAGFGENVLNANDDNSTEFIDVTSVFESGLNFFGTTYNGFYINNNGNITFNNPLDIYSPFSITDNTGTPIIAPFFGDVDTDGGSVTPSPGGNSTGSNLVYWDLNPVDGTVTVTWDDVGEFNNGTVPNAFQLRLTDIGGGNFTIEFRYEDIQWYTGGGSGNARAGFSAADGTNFFELSQSGTEEMLNLETATNINQPGVYKFSIVNGVPNQSPTDIELSGANVDENSDNGIVVGNLTTADPDADNSHTYTLVDDAGGRFAISGNKIVVANGGLLNYETITSHEIIVRTSDVGGLSYDKSFTITVNDVPEPDLSVTNVSAPQSANLGETIKVNWTVTNIGDGAVLPDWVDYVYLSDDTTIDENDTQLTTRTINSSTPLEFNQFYEEKLVEITIPETTATGNKYLLFAADRNDNLPEDNKENNVLEQAITITAPDLQVQVDSLSISANPTFGQSINLNWTILNNGDGATSLGWRDRLYLSKDRTLGNEDDILLWTENINDDFVLAPNGGTYNGSTTVNLPLNPTLLADTYYVLLETDIDNKQIENDETNNTDDLSQLISLPPLPNLIIDNITVPTSEYSGQRVQISWTLQNQGDAAVTGPWFDEVYFSEDDEIGNEDDQLIKSFEFTGTIEAGQSITRKQEITLPIDWSGDRWIGVKTDSNNQIYEHNKEDDNESISTQPINIRLSDFPNLKVSSVTPPDFAFSGAETTVRWTVQNIGDAATEAAYWYDEVWLSKDNELDRDGDYYLGKTVNSKYLNPNESYNNSLTTSLPLGIGDNWHFIVVTDAPFSTWATNYPDGLVYEYNKEDDNELSSVPTPVELTSPPDLQVTQVTIAPSTPFSGQQATVTWTVTNTGNGVTQPGQDEWYDKLYISKSPDNTLESHYLGQLKHTGSLLDGESYTARKTVNLPIDKWEDYFFVVVADADKQVYEQAFEDNNVGFLDANTQDEIDTPTNILLTPPADLTVDEVSTSQNAVAGTEITINYKVSNSGLSDTALRTPRWNDNFYLSTSNTFDKATFYQDAIYLGNKNHYGALTAGGYYKDTATFSLPDNLDEGNYYVFIITDSGNEVFEQDDVDEVKQTNLALSNVGHNVNPVSIISRPADLVVTAVNASPTAEAGKTTRISWSVSNQGTGDSAASWNDRIIASTNNTLGDGDDIELARFSRNNGVLSAGETDSRTEDVLIPFELKGEYHLFVQTDTNNDVYEADKENNNDSTNLPLTTINVNRNTPDLEVFDVSADDGISGKPLTVSWKVKNIGEGPTNTDYWYDEVFLSTDQSISTDDTYLGAIRHSGVLGVGEEYPVTSTSDFIVPLNMSGDYYVIVRGDSNISYPRYSNRVLEISEENNKDFITLPINITLSPVPDLQVTSVDAPQTAISAQELSLSWTVSNFGADSGNVNWTDAVYLSPDKIFDRSNDIYLGSFSHTEGLANGDSYTETQSFTVPRGLSGPFYAFVVTDSRNDIEERGDNFNNDNYDEVATQVILPPPADLVPVAESFSFNANGIPGQFATINYTVNNQGNDAALGSWSDALYLSTDNQWDINDTLIGLSQHSGDVAVGGEYNGSLNAILPGVVPGDYHVLLHSDIRNQVPETDEENNKVASLGKVTIDFESLNIGGNVTGSLAQGQEVYYKIDAQAGQAIRLQLDSANNNAVNELYIRYGEMPTRGQFDYTADDPFQADPEFVVPVEKDGTYYVLVYGNSVNASSYTLSATDIPFSVIKVETNTVGNVGEATLKVEGARFDSGTSFELIDEQGQVISQTQVRLEDSTTAFVTFDFTDQTLGSYSIKATQTSGEIATLADTVTVQEGIGAIINDTINGPQRVWAGQKYPINVSYGNSGDVDTEAPLLIVRNKNSATGTTSRYNNENQEDKVVLLYGLGKDVGTDTLRPQESHSIPLYFSHLGTEDEDASVIVETISSDNIEFISFEDWAMLQQSTKPDSLSDTDWNVFWSNVQPGIGQTWGNYAELIAQLSEAYNQPGERIYDVKELFARWYADTDSTLFQFKPRPSISGQLIDEETGLPATEVVLNLYQEELPGRYFYQFATDEEGKFKVDSLGSGTYKLAIPNGYSFADSNQSVGSIDANDAFYTIPVAVDSGDIDLTLDINPPPPPPFDPSYLESFKENYPEIQQEMDEIIDGLSSEGSQSSNSSGSSGNTSSNLITEPSSNGLPIPAFPGGGGDIVIDTPFGDFKFGSSYSRDEKRKCDGAYAEDSFKVSAATPTIIEDAAISFTPAGSLKFRSDYTVDKKSCLYEHEKTTVSAGIDFVVTSTNPLTTVLWIVEKLYSNTEVAPVLAFIRDTIDRLQKNIPFIEEYVSASVSLGGGLSGKAVINDDGAITGSILNNLSFKGALNIDFTALDIPFKASIALSGVITRQMLPYPFLPEYTLSASVLLQVGRFQFAPSTNPISIGFKPPLPFLPPGREFGRGLLEVFRRNLSDYTLPDDCKCEPEDYSPTLLKSADPNDILGPSGYGSEKWIPATDPLEYTIRFENMSTATAPAKQVVVTQKLDSDLDLRSFRLGSLGWGDLVFQVPENRSFYSERIDLTSEYGIYADITAFIDIATGEIKWEIKAIDPETG
ncbi:MAG: hypothetical protein HC815_34015, partial [Richelia sp. RM1_1_1]|nr:hypothetical protein [Richelia sp. RM1_1_1]